MVTCQKPKIKLVDLDSLYTDRTMNQKLGGKFIPVSFATASCLCSQDYNTITLLLTTADNSAHCEYYFYIVQTP
jgi:hypothetical protein